MYIDDAIQQNKLKFVKDTSFGKNYKAAENIKLECKYKYGTSTFAWNRISEIPELHFHKADKHGNTLRYFQVFKCLHNPMLITDFKLPWSITILDDNCFFLAMNLTNTNALKDSQLKHIGFNAFSKCYRIGIHEDYATDNLHLPDSLESIDYSAFSECYSLKTVFIPKNVKFIGQNAFSSCSFLKYLVFIGKTEAEIRNMPCFGSWTQFIDNTVKYVPGLLDDGSENPDIHNLTEDNSNIGFSVSYTEENIKTIDLNTFKAISKEFFESYNNDNISSYDIEQLERINNTRKTSRKNNAVFSSSLEYLLDPYTDDPYTDDPPIDECPENDTSDCDASDEPSDCKSDDVPCLSIKDIVNKPQKCDAVIIVDNPKPPSCESNPILRDGPSTPPTPTPPTPPPPLPLTPIDESDDPPHIPSSIPFGPGSITGSGGLPGEGDQGYIIIGFEFNPGVGSDAMKKAQDAVEDCVKKISSNVADAVSSAASTVKSLLGF